MRLISRLSVPLTASILISLPSEACAASFDPVQQSECESRLIAYRTAHPTADPFTMMKMGGLFTDLAPPPGPPLALHDEGSGLTITTGADGRHIKAYDEAGKLVWDRNPFVDRNLCPYRTPHPFISWIGSLQEGADTYPLVPRHDENVDVQMVKAIKEIQSQGYQLGDVRDSDRFIALKFNSSQFGYVSLRNGDFYFFGQN